MGEITFPWGVPLTFSSEDAIGQYRTLAPSKESAQRRLPLGEEPGSATEFSDALTRGGTLTHSSGPASRTPDTA
jgi:hypothetical protein